MGHFKRNICYPWVCHAILENQSGSKTLHEMETATWFSVFQGSGFRVLDQRMEDDMETKITLIGLLND